MSTVAAVAIRAAVDGDLAAINDIYNHYVETTAITFDVSPRSLDERARWFEHFGERGPHRVLVALRDDGVVGYACSHPYRPRPAYSTTVETTVYCNPACTGRGVGSALYAALFESLHGEDVHRAIAGVTLPNDASLRLHHRFGFNDIGVQHEVGRKFDRYWDVLLLEKALA